MQVQDTAVFEFATSGLEASPYLRKHLSSCGKREQSKKLKYSSSSGADLW